ncbi:tetratricopeptide repeat protein [Helicobacter sp. 11S02596-1]|uniref:tetratricopeptide repeat protein n=1 Tax=Helicobacter sp. 11S02596-1 TaxID=1476194 RepID=UPI000BCEE4CF|nr:tetratricopeptide repeat protein [Helicobacter sp. 11S02596-1]PAF44208.1 hypothetical protein BJI48_03225 [Helicobacter sp. 11S02596-1]
MRQVAFFHCNKFLLALLACLTLNAEPSAFELQSGATKKELKTLQSSSKNLESIITDLRDRVASLEQTQDGLRSLFEGQSLKIKNLLDTAVIYQNSIKSLQSVQELHSETLKKQSDLLDNLKNQVEANKQSIKDLDKKITDMGELLSHINTTMVAQLEVIKKNLEIQTPDPDVNKKPKQSELPKPADKVSFEKDMSKQKQIFEDATKLFYQKKLKESKARLDWLVETNYRPANSLYLLGEIAYKEKKYQEAIVFYKKSALLNDKANYMSILLWHTAWAFKYSKDLANYNKFLESLIYLYPQSEQGQKAKEIINRTKGKK